MKFAVGNPLDFLNFMLIGGVFKEATDFANTKKESF